MSAADILPWCGTLSIAVAALVILAGPPARRDRRAEDETASRRCPLQQLMRTSTTDAMYVDRFLDVNAEPWVLTLPDAADRRYLFQVLSGRADVFDDVDEHVAWTTPQTYAITGPNWNGELPADVTEHRSPAAIIWLLGRVECTGTAEDRAAAQDLLNRISLVPLSAYVTQFVSD
jgi:hypothetical protein